VPELAVSVPPLVLIALVPSPTLVKPLVVLPANRLIVPAELNSELPPAFSRIEPASLVTVIPAPPVSVTAPSFTSPVPLLVIEIAPLFVEIVPAVCAKLPVLSPSESEVRLTVPVEADTVTLLPIDSPSTLVSVMLPPCVEITPVVPSVPAAF